MEKSANKLWKDSGSTLSFKEWINRENQKKESGGNFIPFNATHTSDTAQEIINESLQNSNKILADESAQIKAQSGYKTSATPNKVLGLDSSVLVLSTLLIAGSLTYYFYTKLKKK
jgi:hypothetical protein